jgi:hypothetical protein
MARRRGETSKVYVTILGGLKYGFRTNKAFHLQHGAILGQDTYVDAAGVFFGANSPKPAKATLETSSGIIGSFCSTAKIDDLKAANWTVTRRNRIRGVKTSGKTRTVYVDMPGGYKYAWNITAAEVDLAADLGFVAATGADASNLIWGVNYPKPPRASKKENGSNVSTFCKPQKSVMDAATTAGYSISGVDYDLIPNL